MFNFKSYYDLSRDIAANAQKLPYFDVVVGVPKSGLIPACIIASFFNKPLYDLDSFTFSFSKRSGVRKITHYKNEPIEVPIALVVDDSFNTGNEMRRVRARLSSYDLNFHFKYCAIYGLSNNYSHDEIDICLTIVPQPRLFQWNYRNHIIAQYACFDIDGVLCEDPDETQNDDGEKYRQFLLNAKPLFIPQKKISCLVTSRLEKYRGETQEWLKKKHVNYGELIMLDLPSAEKRRKLKIHGKFKADIYKKRSELIFIESNWRQAQQIAEIADKPVLCTENDVFLYGKAHQSTLKANNEIFSAESISVVEGLRIENQRLIEKLYALEAKGENIPLNESVNSWSRLSIAIGNKKSVKTNVLSNSKKSLRVLMISYSFDVKYGAGAASSSNRLFEALKRVGHDVYLLSKDDFPELKFTNNCQPECGAIISYWGSVHNAKHSVLLREKINKINPDVILLGAIDRGIVSIVDLMSIDYPILWVGRDNWMHTGGCLFQLDFTEVKNIDHVDKSFVRVLQCGHYMDGCNECPAIKSKSEKILASLQFNLKKLLFEVRPDIVFAPISKWLENVMRSSPLIGGHHIKQIYNPIDINTFKPLSSDKKILREKFGLPLSSKIVFLGAHSLNNKRKGVEVLFKAIESIKNKKLDIDFVVMGSGDLKDMPASIRERVFYVGFIGDDKTKVELYNAVDVTALTALQESLSVVASDSICCGTPVVAFETSGVKEYITHRINGYLAKCFDGRDFVDGLLWVCEEGNNKKLKIAARKVAESIFDRDKNAIDYTDLLKATIGKKEKLSVKIKPDKYLDQFMASVDDALGERRGHIRYLKKLSDDKEVKVPLASVCEKRDDAIGDLSTANKLVRQKKYHEALGIYESLLDEIPSNSLKANLNANIEYVKKKILFNEKAE